MPKKSCPICIVYSIYYIKLNKTSWIIMAFLTSLLFKFPRFSESRIRILPTEVCRRIWFALLSHWFSPIFHDFPRYSPTIHMQNTNINPVLCVRWAHTSVLRIRIRIRKKNFMKEILKNQEWNWGFYQENSISVKQVFFKITKELNSKNFVKKNNCIVTLLQ